MNILIKLQDHSSVFFGSKAVTHNRASLRTQKIYVSQNRRNQVWNGPKTFRDVMTQLCHGSVNLTLPFICLIIIHCGLAVKCPKNDFLSEYDVGTSRRVPSPRPFLRHRGQNISQTKSKKSREKLVLSLRRGHDSE